MRHVVNGLIALEGYVRRVLEIFYQLKEPNAVVRIGISGKGPYPRYRITVADRQGGERVLGAYNDNGTPVPTADANDENWSIGSMSMEKVRQLLGRIRQQRKGRA